MNVCLRDNYLKKIISSDFFFFRGVFYQGYRCERKSTSFFCNYVLFACLGINCCLTGTSIPNPFNPPNGIYFLGFDSLSYLFIFPV